MGKIYSTISKDKTIKMRFADTTDVVNDARLAHGLSKTAACALGRTLTATSIMASTLKNENDTITAIIAGDGPGGRIVVTGKNDGKIKGYVDNNVDLPARESDGKIDVSGYIGKGTLNITMDLGMKEPYSGSVPLLTSEIGDDFAYYLLNSNQVKSAVGLGVLVDVDLSIKEAGGFILELMPDCPEENIEIIEKNLAPIKSITDLLLEYTPEEIIKKIYGEMEYEILEVKDIEFGCDCSREKVEDSIASIGVHEIEKIIEEDGHAHVVCHFCSKEYDFNKEDLEEILKKAAK